MSEIKSMVEFENFRQKIQWQNNARERELVLKQRRALIKSNETEVLITRAGEKISLGAGSWDITDYIHDYYKSFKFNTLEYIYHRDLAQPLVSCSYMYDNKKIALVYDIPNHWGMSDSANQFRSKILDAINADDVSTLHELLDPIFDKLHVDEITRIEQAAELLELVICRKSGFWGRLFK